VHSRTSKGSNFDALILCPQQSRQKNQNIHVFSAGILVEFEVCSDSFQKLEGATKWRDKGCNMCHKTVGYLLWNRMLVGISKSCDTV